MDAHETYEVEVLKSLAIIKIPWKTEAWIYNGR